MSERRILIVNADDFGRTAGVNRGVIRSHETGIVTSATLMVRWPAAVEAAAYARANVRLSVGLHLDLAEWEYTSERWHPIYEVVDPTDERGVAEEARRQLDRFVELVGRPPTHLDSHQHVHREEPARSVLEDLGRQLDVPVRDLTTGVRYCGEFYGQDGRGHPFHDAISVSALAELLRRLPGGITELGCHPGDVDDLDNVYRHERVTEVATLCDPLIRDVLTEEGIELLGFGDLPPAPRT